MQLKKTFKIAISTLIIIWLLIGITLYLNQSKMIYFPNNQDFNSCINFQDYQKIDINGTRAYFNNKSNNLIVFYHGNAGSTCDRTYLKKLLESENYSILFMEYTGYSADNNKPNKKLIITDVDNIVTWIKDNNFKKTTVISESIGSGPASYQANISEVNKLILISPFSKMEDLIRIKVKFLPYPLRLMLKENYDNIAYLTNYKNKIIIIHGTKDIVIPITSSKELYLSLSTEDKEYYVISGAGHNDLLGFSEVVQRILNEIKLD